jgi:peroxiredoxin/regulator of sirC expression with transglutaminase-like and TPR domain
MSKREEKIRIAGVLSILSILLLTMPVSASRNLKIGDKVPDFTLQDTDGTEVSLDNLGDKVVVIIFWRAEQERSVEALAALQTIYTEFRDQGVEVLALSSEEGGLKPIGKIKQSKQLTFAMLYDKEQKLYGDYGVIGIPSTFVIDKEGKLSYYYPGYRDDYSRQIHGRLEVLLGKKTFDELQAELQPTEKSDLSEAEKKAGRYLKAGNRLLEKGMMELAMKQYEKAVQENPDIFEAHLHLGNIYLAQKKTEEANAAFSQAIKLKPKSAEAYTGLGYAFFLQEQQKEAVEMLQTALKLNPKLARAHYSLGRIYEEQKRIEDALKEYKIALKILLKLEE